jgi:hypothetical protein
MFPPFDRHGRSEPKVPYGQHERHDSPLDFGVYDSSAMANGNEPYIKLEPNDFGFDPNQFM